MFETMKTAALLQKVTTRDPAALTAPEVLEMATSGGALACGLGGITGRLAVGYAADIVMVNAARPHLTPLHDPVSALVYAARASDVDTVLVNGKIVLQAGALPGFDETEFLAHAQERALKLRSLAGV
jgi:5-methylthioadenosine/S-adenosylhomocysteine deaminase